MGNAGGIVDGRDFAVDPRGGTGRSPDFTIGTPESANDDTDFAVGTHDVVVDNPVFAVDNPVRQGVFRVGVVRQDRNRPWGLVAWSLVRPASWVVHRPWRRAQGAVAESLMGRSTKDQAR